MSVLTVQVTDQILQSKLPSVLVSGSVGVNQVAITHTDHARDGFDVSVVFWREDRADSITVPVTDNRCIIPAEVLECPGQFHMGLVGYSGDKRMTSTVLLVAVENGLI